MPNIPKADTPCNSNFAVKYLAHFASTIASEKIQENEIVVFFNLESLFTNVKM